MTTERIRVIDGRSVPHVWFNFEVDDLPLDAYELRMYFHIVRRGSKSGLCNESVDNMAKHCRMSSGVAKRAIRTLIKLGLIRREAHAGRPSDYVVQDMSDWNTEEINALKEGGSETTQVIRRPRLSDDPGYQTTETQVASDPCLGHERSTPGSETTHKVDQFKKDSLSNSIEGFSNTPLTPQRGNPSEPDEPISEEEEASTEKLATPDSQQNDSVALPSSSGKDKSSGATSQRKKRQTRKRTADDIYRDLAIREPDKFAAWWQWYRGKVCTPYGANHGDRAAAAGEWIKLVDAGVDLQRISAGSAEYLRQLRAKPDPVGIPHGSNFLKGSKQHPTPYWESALRDAEPEPAMDENFMPDDSELVVPMTRKQARYGVDVDALTKRLTAKYGQSEVMANA